MTNVSTSPILRDLRRSWPGFLISIVCLFAVFSIADIDKLRNAIALADYSYFLPSVLIFFVAIFTRTLAWRILLEETVSMSQAFFALNEGYLLNNLLPFRLGEVGRSFLLSRTAGIGFLRVLSSILIERIFDLSMVVGILLITLPYVVGADEWARPAAIAMTSLLFLAMVFFHLLARSRERTLRWFERSQQRIRVLRRIPHQQVETFFKGLSTLTDWRRFLGVAALLAFTWFLITWHYYLVLLAFVPEGEFLWAAFGIGVVGIGVAIPSAPGSVGIVQGVIVGVFPALFGLDQSVALAYSITVHAIYLSVTSGLGLIGLVKDGQSLAQVYESVQRRFSRNSSENDNNEQDNP